MAISFKFTDYASSTSYWIYEKHTLAGQEQRIFVCSFPDAALPSVMTGGIAPLA